MRNRILEKYEVIVVVATNPNYLKASILKRYFIVLLYKFSLPSISDRRRKRARSR